MTNIDDKIKLNKNLSETIMNYLDELNKQIKNQDISTDISFEDLDKQFEFYNLTLNEFEILNHNYILKLRQLEKNNNKLKNENNTLKDNNNKLKNENNTLKDNNNKLNSENKKLNQKNNDLINESNSLNKNEKCIAKMLKIEKQKNNELEYLKRQNYELLQENKHLKTSLSKKNNTFLKRLLIKYNLI